MMNVQLFKMLAALLAIGMKAFDLKGNGLPVFRFQEAGIRHVAELTLIDLS